MNKSKEKKHIPYASRLQLTICIILCPVFIVLYALLRDFTEIDSVFLAVALQFSTYHTVLFGAKLL